MKALLFSLMIVTCAVNAGATEGLPPEARQILAETQGEPAAVAAEAPAASNLPATAAIPEDKIPLRLDQKRGETSGDGVLGRILLGALILGAMIFGAWYYLRRLSRPGQREAGPQIKILNQHWLGPKKSLAIIRVAGESILIGVTDQNINLIKPLSLMDDEVPEVTPSRFGHALSDAGANEKNQEDPEEDFQMSGINQIKDVVSRRLKGMRSLE